MGDSITEGNEPLPKKLKEYLKIPPNTDTSYPNKLDQYFGGQNQSDIEIANFA